MIKNVALTTPTVGRIVIGELYEREGRNLPRRLNHFMITTQFKKDGSWVLHPIHRALLRAQNPDAPEGELDGKKIREIPIKLMFNKPELNVSSRLEAYDAEGRMVCAGDGEKARRVVDNMIEEVGCTGCDTCQFGREHRCDKMVRLIVLPNVECKEYPLDGMSGFILRSKGHNTYKALTAKLERLHKLFNGNLLGVPMTLRLLGKSSRESFNSPFYYVAIDLAKDIFESIRIAKETKEQFDTAGLNVEDYEAIVEEQLSRSVFHESLDDLIELEELIIPSGGKDDSDQLSETEPIQKTAPVGEQVFVGGLDALRTQLTAAGDDEQASAMPKAA